jgi:hypothetical protein
VTIVVSDTISVLLNPSSKGPPIFVGTDATAIILSQAKLYSKKLAKSLEDEEYLIEEPIA